MAFTTPHLNSSWRVSGAGFRHAECEKARKVVKIRAKSEFLSGPGAWCGSDGRQAWPFVIRQKHSHQRLQSPSTSTLYDCESFRFTHVPSTQSSFWILISLPTFFVSSRLLNCQFSLQALLRPAPLLCVQPRQFPAHEAPVMVWIKVSATSLRRLKAASVVSLWLMNNLSH